MAVAVASLMGACKKEGTFNPKEKISKVYREHTSTYAWYNGEEWVEESHSQPKTLSEIWTWDGKLLSKIEYPYTYEENGSEITEYDVVTFTYDGKQLVEANSEDERMVVTYDGKKLDKVEVYWDKATTPSSVFTFTYDGKKISKIVNTISEDMFGKAKAGRPQMGRMMHLLAQSLLPGTHDAEKIFAAAHKMAAKSGAKESETLEMTLTWDGDNISKITASFNGIAAATAQFTFDDKKNPYQGFVYGLVGEIPSDETGLGFANENNITKVEYSYPDEEPDVEEYTYTYDGKWPVTCTQSRSYSDEYNRNSYSYITYFEYK